MMFNAYRDIEIPFNLTISSDQLKNAKIYSNRWQWIETLPTGLNIIEVGVGAGDFSEHIIKSISPNRLYLLDTYHLGDLLIARPGMERRYLPGENYYYIANRFKEHPEVKIVKSRSQEYLPDLSKIMPKYFDMIYLDANHEFDNLCEELDHSVRLLKDDGILAFNDYVFSDENGEVYGVVQAVNRFLYANRDWEVIGIALDERMYCDIYIRKIQS